MISPMTSYLYKMKNGDLLEERDAWARPESDFDRLVPRTDFANSLGYDFYHEYYELKQTYYWIKSFKSKMAIWQNYMLFYDVYKRFRRIAKEIAIKEHTLQQRFASDCLPNVITLYHGEYMARKIYKIIDPSNDENCEIAPKKPAQWDLEAIGLNRIERFLLTHFIINPATIYTLRTTRLKFSLLFKGRKIPGGIHNAIINPVKYEKPLTIEELFDMAKKNS